MTYKRSIQLSAALVGLALAAYTLPAATTWTHNGDNAFNWTDTTQWTTSGDVPSTTYPDTAGDMVIVTSSGTSTRNVTLPGSGVTIGKLLSGKGGSWNPIIGAPSRYFNFTGGTITMDDTGGDALSPATGKPTVGGGNSSYGTSVYGNLAGNQGVAFWRNVPIGLNANTFTGDADLVDATTVRILSVDALPYGGRTGDVNLNPGNPGLYGCTLDLFGTSITINGLNSSSSTTAGQNTVTSANGGDVTLTVGDNNASGNFLGNIIDGSANLGLTKIGTGTQSLGGINTYTGNTTVNGGELNLADNARLSFQIGNTGSAGNLSVNNWITGTGTLTLDGDFSFDVSGAALAENNTWNIVDIANLNETFASTFSVVGFIDQGDDTWDAQIGAWLWTFDETTGNLSVIPEPSTLVLGLLGGLGLLMVFRRRRLT